MTKIIITTVMTLLAIVCNAQVSENREARKFSKIEVQSGIELVYTQSEEFAIKPEATNTADLQNLITEVNGKTLKIYYDQKAKEVATGKILKVYVSGNNVSSFKASSKAKIIFSNYVDAKEIEIDVASGASFNGMLAKNEKTVVKAKSGATLVGRFDTDYLKGDFKSGAAASLAGNAKRVNLTTSSGAFCTARNLASEVVSVNATEVSSILIHADGKFTAISDVSSSITCFGNPTKVTLAENSFLVAKKKTNNPVLIAMD